MGSFNIVCSVSNISISSGDPIVFIPLEVAKYPYKVGDGNHTLISSHCFYAPVTMPIFGEYDDYGGIENIIRDENLEIIEAYFKKTFKSVDGVNNFGKVVSSGMFVHRKIFDCMVRDMQKDEFGKNIPQRAKRISDLFNYMGEIRKAKKKCAIYKAMEEESDKNWHRPHSRFASIDKPIFTSFNGLFETKYSGLVGNQREMFTQPPFMHQNTRLDLKLLRRLDKSKGCFTKLENNMFGVYSVFKFRDYKTFNKIYQPVLQSYDPTKQDEGLFTAFIDFAVFEDSLYAINNFYFPGMNGYQCGHKYASEVLYNKAKEITDSEIAEDIKREEEWERWRQERKSKEGN